MIIGIVGDAERAVAWERHIRPHNIVRQVALAPHVHDLDRVDACFVVDTTLNRTEHLIDALKEEKIAGAGLDVYDKEPLPQDHKLRFLPNALILPHIGYVTAENYSKFYLQMIENLESCLKNKPLRKIS